MKFAILSHVQHFKKDSTLWAYAPYVKEMNLWLNHVDVARVVAPVSKASFAENKNILLPYQHEYLVLENIPSINFLNPANTLKSILQLPFVLFKIFSTCLWADHIHLRCPGNIGLLGCLVQILFPWKPKTTKYAGNWDPKAKQPLSYRLQKWILNNRFLTRNIQVLVYGDWPGSSKNIVPFFTATYSEKEKTALPKRDYAGELRFVFAGSLSGNKHPMKALEWVYQLQKTQHLTVRVDFYGDGPENKKLSDFIEKNKLVKNVKLHGNQTNEVLKQAYQTADFLLLPSQSEGWPKVVAEAMFWGVIPIVSPVSCVPWMLDFGKRGLFFETDVSKTTERFISLIKNPDALQKMAELAADWSRNYTLEKFEVEIQNLQKPKPL
ncbi:MAG: glycosyl transferase [Flavobacteriales bacterium CG_4_9_14_3_um_filter_40_17]|nr:MAG: glycosyl transferase [Flavobacteriales bacterium CG_4_9_14_3_um_filter_40_17]